MTRFFFIMSRPVIAILCNFPAWLVNDEIPIRAGHYAVWLMSLHEALKKQSLYDIHWITLHKDIDKKIVFDVANQHFHVLPAARRKIGLYTAYLYDRWQIKKELRQIKPHLLHAWGTEYCYGLAIKDFKGKSILSMQGVLKACIERVKMSPFEIKHSKYETPAIQAADLITTESPWAVDRVLEQVPQASVTLWEYAAETRFFDAKREIAASPFCLMAGSNTPVKDVPTAIAAFSRPELQHIKLYLAGIPPEAYPNLPSNIILLGRIGRDKMVELLSSTWCLVHPSLADSSPNIVKEARVIGVAAIVTTECGGKQYIEDGKSGFVIKPKDVDALTKAVLYITKDKQTATTMGLYNIDSCRHALSATTMINNLISIYRQKISFSHRQN